MLLTPPASSAGPWFLAFRLRISCSWGAGESARDGTSRNGSCVELLQGALRPSRMPGTANVREESRS